MASTWLVKTEPSTYSFADLVRDGTTRWDGVRNPVAQKHLRAMRPGDEVFVYHTGDEKAVVGWAKVASAPYDDPKDAKLAAVDLQAGKPLARAVTLAEVKKVTSLAGFDLVRLPRLSVMPVPAEARRELERLAKTTA